MYIYIYICITTHNDVCVYVYICLSAVLWHSPPFSRPCSSSQLELFEFRCLKATSRPNSSSELFELRAFLELGLR